jgi:hypothetical protein
MVGVMGLGASGCANTERSVLYDRDEPEQRLAAMVDGIVAGVDESQQVVVLDNGQMYRVTGDRAIIVNGQPATLATVRPGSRVTIVSGTPVVYQDGRYVVVGAVPPATATVTTPGAVVTSPPAAVVTAPPAPVVTAPPAAVVTAPPAGVVTTPPTAVVTAPAAPVPPGMVRMYGRVTDIDRNGNVKILLADGNAFEFRPPAGMVVRQGDTVAIDVAFGTVAPSALPR